MAGGSYVKKGIPQEPAPTLFPPRATRSLRTVKGGEENDEEVLPIVRRPARVVDAVLEHPLARHGGWLTPLVACMVMVVTGSLVLISAGVFQRTGDSSQLLPFPNGRSYSIQVGGSINAIDSWQNSNGPISPKTPIPTHTGPYAVLGSPSIRVDFINQVLASYNSPAAGKGQALYDLGVKYGVDPAYALAFFLHESTLGTQGEARVTLSLGNIRCVPKQPCRDGYSQYGSWEEGFEAWYKLIRNLYVAQWGLVTVDQIIPTYAPASDNNNEKGYIGALKHYLDTWHAGVIRP
jgi:hypothetical protein